MPRSGHQTGNRVAGPTEPERPSLKYGFQELFEDRVVEGPGVDGVEESQIDRVCKNRSLEPGDREKAPAFEVA
jgi:hypothetical protein